MESRKIVDYSLIFAGLGFFILFVILTYYYYDSLYVILYVIGMCISISVVIICALDVSNVPIFKREKPKSSVLEE